jgi:hypothetical protein
MSKEKQIEELTNEYTRGCNEVCDWAIKTIKNIPTADVVPKSEVDRAYERGLERGKKDNVCGFSAEEIAQKVEKIAIELEAMRMAANSYKMHYENARVEVAREIFEEIESISSDYPIYGNVNTVILSERDLAFIKKKYTEGKDEQASIQTDHKEEFKK